MKVIDLLNKIASKEEIPQQIRFRRLVYYFDGRGYFHNKDEDTSEEAFLEGIRTDMVLNEEIEIIEEKKEIEELLRSNVCYEDIDNPLGMLKAQYEQSKEEICDKINELIKEVNKLKKEGK